MATLNNSASASRSIPDTASLAQSKNVTDSVRMYLAEIGRIPLLTHEQELDYGKQVQKMMSLLEAKEALGKKLRREPTTQEWALHVQISEASLSATIQTGQRAKQKIISANLRLVVMIAKKYQKRNLEFLDLIQEGAIGLGRAAEKYDPARGFKFSTYAYWWIRQAMTRAIAQQARTIRLPIHITEKLNKIKKVQRQLSQRLRRVATVPEVAAELGITPEQVREYLERARLPVSLSKRIGENGDTELGELLEDKAASPEEFVIASSRSDEIKHLMSELNAQQREVLTLRFGLEDGQPLTLTQIGARLSMSRERVRQIEHKAMIRLRRHKRAWKG